MFEKPEFKPCPFCGSSCEDISNHPTSCYLRLITDNFMAFATWDAGLHHSKEEMCEAWNTRYVPTCHWEYKQRDEVYETTCGHAFIWEPHGVPDYCPGCGARVKVVE